MRNHLFPSSLYSLADCISLSFSPSLSLPLFLSLSFSPSLSLPLFLSLSFSPSLSLPLFLSLSRSRAQWWWSCSPLFASLGRSLSHFIFLHCDASPRRHPSPVLVATLMTMSYDPNCPQSIPSAFLEGSQLQWECWGGVNGVEAGGPTGASEGGGRGGRWKERDSQTRPRHSPQGTTGS